MAKQLSDYNSDERAALISKILSSDLHGKRIYLIGTAEFGPVNEPILVRTTAGVHNKFGTQGTLIDAFHAVKYVSTDNQVYLVKTTGEHSVAYLNVNIKGGEVINDGLVLTISQANELFNETRILIDVSQMTITFPKEAKKDPIVYKYSDYPNMSRFVNAINQDTKNGKSFVYAYYNVAPEVPVMDSLYSVNPTIVYFNGGECGLTYSKNLYYSCLERTYDILESHEIDIIIPVDAFIDDVYPDDSAAPMRYNMTYYKHDKDYLTETTTGYKRTFLNQLINFCIRQLHFGMVTTGIMGFNSSYKYWSRYLYESDDIAVMYEAALEYNLKQCDNPWYSFLVSVVAGDICYNKGTIIDNGYLAYAALCANTSYISGTTNIPISDSIKIWHEFSEDVLKELAESGIVTYRHSPLYNTPVIYDGITASTKDENLKLYCNVRMIQLAVSYINQLFQWYIGQNIEDLIKRKIMKQDLDTILISLESSNIITHYEYKIIPNYAAGEIRVYLALKTNYMIKSIHVCSVINLEYIQE